jgi:hypothetical protein
MTGNPMHITVRDIQTERNAEVRRVLIERMGHERYLSESRARLVSHDETGVLWCSDYSSYGQARSLWFLEVRNGTREPDGTYKRYFLRVPPHMRTPRAAVAWTYGLNEQQYRPLIRT